MSQNSLPATAPKRPLLIILLTIVAVAACAAAGYSWWLLQQRDGGAQTAIEKENRPRRQYLCRWIPSPSIW